MQSFGDENELTLLFIPRGDKYNEEFFEPMEGFRVGKKVGSYEMLLYPDDGSEPITLPILTRVYK